MYRNSTSTRRWTWHMAVSAVLAVALFAIAPPAEAAKPDKPDSTNGDAAELSLNQDCTSPDLAPTATITSHTIDDTTDAHPISNIVIETIDGEQTKIEYDDPGPTEITIDLNDYGDVTTISVKAGNNATTKRGLGEPFPIDTTWCIDTDNDGIPDRVDNCPDVANPDQTDTNNTHTNTGSTNQAWDPAVSDDGLVYYTNNSDNNTLWVYNQTNNTHTNTGSNYGAWGLAVSDDGLVYQTYSDGSMWVHDPNCPT